MNGEVVSAGLIVVSFIVGVLVGAHNANKINADLAVAKNDIAALKASVAALTSKAAATPPAGQA